MIEYLKAHPLPLPKLRPGMTWDEFQTERGGFSKLLKSYLNAMDRDTETRTDEVGHRKSEYDKTKKGFLHVLPPEFAQRKSQCPR